MWVGFLQRVEGLKVSQRRILPQDCNIETLGEFPGCRPANKFWIYQPSHWVTGAAEDKMLGQHYWLNGHEFGQTLGESERQTSLACCSPWGHKEPGTTERLNNTQSCEKVKVLVSQSCLTVSDPTDCSLPGSSVLGILQARTLKWVAMPSFRRLTQPRNQTHVSCVSCIAGGFFNHWAVREVLSQLYKINKLILFFWKIIICIL